MKVKRLVAAYIDLIVVTAISMLMILIYSKFDLFKVFYYFNEYLIIAVILYICKDLIFKNKSIGKRAVGIQVLKEDGSIPSSLELILRNVLAFVWPIEVILIIIQNKKIEDMIFKTIITETNK